MEVGSDVGLTGLLVAVLCRPGRVSINNFTDVCLTNLAHNFEVVNWYWLEGRGVVTGKGGMLTTVRALLGLSLCPIFGGTTPCVCMYLPPRAQPQKISLVPPHEVPL